VYPCLKPRTRERDRTFRAVEKELPTRSNPLGLALTPSSRRPLFPSLSTRPSPCTHGARPEVLSLSRDLARENHRTVPFYTSWLNPRLGSARPIPKGEFRGPRSQQGVDNMRCIRSVDSPEEGDVVTAEVNRAVSQFITERRGDLSTLSFS